MGAANGAAVASYAYSYVVPDYARAQGAEV
jgi:hypothetical protein